MNLGTVHQKMHDDAYNGIGFPVSFYTAIVVAYTNCIFKREFNC